MVYMKPAPPVPDPTEVRRSFGIGQAVRRKEDARFVTGHGRYVGDIVPPLTAHAVVVRSHVAHGRIIACDTTAAKAAPGVLLVLTGEDVLAAGLDGLTAELMPEDLGAPAGYRTFRPILATDKVRFVGEGVALIVAETAAQAADAMALVDITYEELAAVTTPVAAAEPGAVQVHEGNANGNLAWGLMFGDQEATDAAFAGAPNTVELDLVNNRITATPLEPRCTLGEYHVSTGTYTLHTSCQNPHGIRLQVCQVLGLAESELRVISPDVGGGFGMKGDAYPEDALVLWASRLLSRPVSWVATRSESMQSDNHARDQVVHGELAFDDEGRILAVRARAVHSVGAYIMQTAMVPALFSIRFIPSVYNVTTAHLMTRGMFTTTSPTAVYRGAGRPEANYLMERLLDEAAVKLGIDPVEIRRRNFIPADAFPHLTPTFFNYDSGDFHRVLDRTVELADWEGFEARRAATEARGLRRGRGISYFIEQGGIFNDRMEIRFDPTGTVSIVAGTFNHGQGHETTFAQLVSDFLGVPFESIRYIQGDTDAVLFGRGTYAARSSMIGGSALLMAAKAIVERATPMAAALMEVAPDDLEFEDGRFRVSGDPDKSLTMTEVARAFYHARGITDTFGVGLMGAGTWNAEAPNFPNGCHICEVEVDAETGEVVIDRYTMVDDVGVVINPMIAEGQLHGGLAQGLGQALIEHVVYDPETGQLLSGSVGDYGVPRAVFMPRDIQTAFENTPCTTNPLGVKGVGEASTIGSPPAVMNAVLNALRPLGVTHLDMPATPDRVWEAIRDAATAAEGDAS